ncbi:serine hydrolase domain-containing protein [Aquisphaera insulae]|uniref:serine hydrolase domain-containing protein n=1 Tax=Aquisphaera insulae TaxID=2712864 RepID=UPI0013EA2C0F|nr:serine hydrolase domain-containing protein [Aquisphaera insulae]
MIGRRTWLRSIGLRAAAIAAGGLGLPPSAFAQVAPGSGSTQRRRSARRPVIASPTTPVFPLPSGPVRADERINAVMATVRDRHQVPGLIGAIIRGESLDAIGAAGLRKQGFPQAIQVTDAVHVGSCTKAMTATLLGLLVDEGLVTWDAPIRDLFPELAPTLNADFQGVTLNELLTHRAGLPANVDWWNLPGRSTTEQRLSLLRSTMAKAPSSRPGSKYLYSNVGFAIAGLIAEQVTGEAWESLMTQRLFRPLAMKSAGFGPPGHRESNRADAPWGHGGERGRLKPVWHDNAACLGPAGTVHCSIPDWGRFASLHLRAVQGKPKLLTRESFRALHTPPAGFSYVGGWISVGRTPAGRALTHDGSNTYWYASIWIYPDRDIATIVATNQGSAPAPDACQEAGRELLRIALRDRPAGPS